METNNLVGGAWLLDRYGIELVMPLTVRSRIGGRRATHVADGATHAADGATQKPDGIKTETFVESMRPKATLRGHLTFHLKHEEPHLEFLSRLFEHVDPAELVAWVEDEPGGQYARRAGFLFEWLSGRRLELAAPTTGPYVEAVDPRKVVAASHGCSVRDRRWRVNNNLPGTPAFCPIIRKTEDFHHAIALDLQHLLSDLALEFGEETLMRGAVWMTLRESKASFAIEGEAHHSDRIQRFADALARRTGEGAIPLDNAALATLQSAILGTRTTLQSFGVRQSPVFVGEVLRQQEVVHYVAPPPQDLHAMLAGLAVFWDRTQGQSAVMRSAVLSFGFLYLHPLADGNGRLHRFLINDVLRRDGVVKAPLILPVSALITHDPAERRAYERILDTISRPLMSAVADACEFAPVRTSYPDGIRSNFVFHGNDRARPLWRYLDLTRHVPYLANVLKRTISNEMRAESQYLRSHAQARAAVKDILEMPDQQIDRIIRSVEANQGALSNALAKELPVLTEPGIWDALLHAIQHAFENTPNRSPQT